MCAQVLRKRATCIHIRMLRSCAALMHPIPQVPVLTAVHMHHIHQGLGPAQPRRFPSTTGQNARKSARKLIYQVNLPYDIAVELTLDNVYLCRRGVSSVKSRYEESRYKSGYEGYKSSHLYSSENSRYISGNLSPHSSSANLSPPYQDPARSAYILSPRRSSARPSSSGNSPLIFP